MVQHTNEDVLVIGAGPAGINSAYALEQAGISYKVIDRADIVGYTWANLYPSLSLNTSRFYSHMPDKPFPISYGIYASGRQYHEYLLAYVAERDFNIELGVDVYRVAPQGNRWRVETSAGDFLYKAVISATGIWNNPVMPSIAGMDDFGGTLMHAHDYRDPEQLRDRRVLVVGNGPSGVDISVAAGDVARSAHVAIRNGVILRRRYPLGLPRHGWLLLGERLPNDWCKQLLGFVSKVGYGDLDDIGLGEPPAGSGGMTGYRGRELIDAVRAGKLTPLSAPVAFDAQGATFADGSYQRFDTVVMATGYKPVLHQYLEIDMQFSNEPWQSISPCDWMIGPNGLRGWPLRDTRTHPNGRAIQGYAGLYLVGVYYKGKGAMFNMTVEAAVAARQIEQYLAQLQADDVALSPA
jgi:putative flavoprotein involved in K+ transport